MVGPSIRPPVSQSVRPHTYIHTLPCVDDHSTMCTRCCCCDDDVMMMMMLLLTIPYISATTHPPATTHPHTTTLPPLPSPSPCLFSLFVIPLVWAVERCVVSSPMQECCCGPSPSPSSATTSWTRCNRYAICYTLHTIRYPHYATPSTLYDAIFCI